MWRNYLSARQIAEQLRRFVRINESPSSETSLNTSLSDAGFVLLKLKEQLMYENRYLHSFAMDFVQRGNNGVDVLLRVLVSLQRIHTNRQTNVVVSRSVTSRRRKAAIDQVSENQMINSSIAQLNCLGILADLYVAEADCLECLKILLEKTHLWAAILDYPGNIEVILFSLNSPQLDSKCYAFEIATMLLRQPSGFLLLLRSLTSIAAANRDENRLTPIIAQLKHGLHTGKLHIQILVVRFLNVFRSQAANGNYALLVQIEAENAGFNAERLERVVTEQGIVSGIEHLQRELSIWRQTYSPTNLAGSTLRRPRSRSSYRPSTYDPRYPDYNYAASQRIDSATSDDDDGTWRRNRNPLYDMSKTSATGRYHASAPVERHRARRAMYTTTGSDRGDRTFEYNTASAGRPSGMVHPSSTQFDISRSQENLVHGRSLVRPGGKQTRYSRSDSMPAVTRARSEGSMQRIFDYDQQQPQTRHSQFRSASVTPMESRQRDAAAVATNYQPQYQQHRRGISRSVHDLGRINEEGSRPSSSRGGHRLVPYDPVVPTEPIQPVEGMQMTLPPRSMTPVLTRYVTNEIDVDRDPDDRAVLVHQDKDKVVKQLPSQNGIQVEIVEDRNKSMKGFSYLFPHQPVTTVAKLQQRATTPDPAAIQYQQQQERSLAFPPESSAGSIADTPSGTGDRATYAYPETSGGTSKQFRQPRSAPSFDQESAANQGGPEGDQQQQQQREQVVYIPVKVQGVQGSFQRGARGFGSIGGSTAGVQSEDEVKDALSKFDYLNEYETSSRGSRF